jgi:hypothetical protein
LLGRIDDDKMVYDLDQHNDETGDNVGPIIVKKSA